MFEKLLFFHMTRNNLTDPTTLSNAEGWTWLFQNDTTAQDTQIQLSIAHEQVEKNRSHQWLKTRSNNWNGNQQQASISHQIFHKTNQKGWVLWVNYRC